MVWHGQGWPLVAHCDKLTRLCLKCLPSSWEDNKLVEQLPTACHSLQEVQLTYAYSAGPVPEGKRSMDVRPL